MLKRQAKLGRTIDQLSVGEKLHITETITDKDLLLYLGLTNDNNPLYIQHDYANTTPFEKPIVPSILLNGLVSTSISKYLSGPGSHIVEQHLSYLTPVYHEETIELHFEIVEIDMDDHRVKLSVDGFNEFNSSILSGTIFVIPPQYS